MGSGRFVGGFDGTRGVIRPVGGSLIQPGSLMAGGVDGWDQPILQAGGGGGGCSPVGLHTDGTSGTFTLTTASGSATILGTAPYAFTCTGLAHVSLSGTIDSQSSGGAVGNDQLYPTYGIFIVTVVPPANQLFSIILPDVQITTPIPTDALFHTFTGGPVVEVNPGAARTIVFAVKPNEVGTGAVIPTTYNYKNFILDVTGV
ncbi:MAG TPA: hypothetical protein VGY48_15740 [Vicinamibacterales bacterium]|jgi:hypothetical protein|nr:hypothetical protein [Vicinamibacterales bacterium]